MSACADTSFSDLGLSEPLLRAVNTVGYESPSPIQAAAIPPLLAGRDLLGQAQTGTGKTAAFALPLLSRLDLARTAPQILVLTPTRELAIQVAEAFKTYARFLAGFRVLPVYGGQGYEAQLRPLRRGVHAVVGTPGRILDHLRRGSLSLDALATVVLDEADEMLRMGFLEDVERILEHAPAGKQLALFSATMPAAIRAVTRTHMRDAVEIRIASATATVSTVSQRYWPVAGMHKLDALTRILEVEDFDAMLIFVRTKIATAELADRLEARGFCAAALNGDMAQPAREQIVERLKAGRLDILVATDVAARGLDVERISHVVNYDIPYDTEAYVHRIGRTARAGRAGKAILFVAPRERRMLRAIENATGQVIEAMSVPSRDDVADVRSGRFKAAIGAVLRNEDLAPFESLIESVRAEHDVPVERIAAALACMAQGDRPSLPAEDPRRPRAAAADRPPRRATADGAATTPRDAPEREPPVRHAAPEREPPLRHATPDHLPAADCVRYRVEVGTAHGAQAKHIVGAIANEAGLDGRHIANLAIHEDHSTVDLPAGMPRDLFKHLKKVRVRGRPLAISVVASANDAAPRSRAAAATPAPDGARRAGGRPAGRAPGGRPNRRKKLHKS